MTRKQTPTKKTKTSDAVTSELTQERLIEIFNTMSFFRRFEEQANRAYTKGKFAGFCHLHIGQEALCVGVQETIRETDYMISGYRSHTQSIAKGIPPEKVMSELFGKADGTVMGKGGSMHMFDKERNLFGGHGIVGGQIGLGAGIAFADKYRKEDHVKLCFFGDG